MTFCTRKVAALTNTLRPFDRIFNFGDAVRMSRSPAQEWDFNGT